MYFIKILTVISNSANILKNISMATTLSRTLKVEWRQEERQTRRGESLLLWWNVTRPGPGGSSNFYNKWEATWTSNVLMVCPTRRDGDWIIPYQLRLRTMFHLEYEESTVIVTTNWKSFLAHSLSGRLDTAHWWLIKILFCRYILINLGFSDQILELINLFCKNSVLIYHQQ